ncbi:hypothetical protein BsWGS_19759 [Bradybaena similaris]
MADKARNESGDGNELVLNQSDKEQTDGAAENGECKQPDDADDSDCFGRPGSQIDDKIIFKNKFGERVAAIPVIVDFNRVLQLKHVGRAEGVISGVSNRDLLHAVAGLYDISLPDMDTETIYATVCARWARTIVLVQDTKDATDDMIERNIKRRIKKEKNKDEDKDKENVREERKWKNKVDEINDTYKEEEVLDRFSAFVDIFSDTEESEEEENEAEEDNSEDEDFTKGISTFLSDATQRQKQREACDTIIAPSLIGIENRLLACATFEKKYIDHKDRVIHLTLISVRPRYRMFKLGCYLLSKCVLPSVVGVHEAVVVHADTSAVDFFRKFGFSDDIILNSRWSQLAEAFTNCTLMTYLPAFTCHTLLHTEITKDNSLELYDMEQEMKKWQKKSREAYVGQLCCMMRYRNEILQLRRIVKTQEEKLSKLEANHAGDKDKFELVKDSDDINTENLLADLQNEMAALSAIRQSSVRHAPPPSPPLIKSNITSPSAPLNLDNKIEVITRFVKAMEIDRSIKVQYTVSSILKAKDNPSLRSRFEAALSNLTDPTMVTELYFCGSLEKPKRLLQILSEGFTEDDFIHGEFGRGLYFSKYPSKAAQFSVLGKLLEVRVALGRIETVIRYDRTRKGPSERYDSIIVPGRLFHIGEQGESAMLCQEYVVFSVDQVMPLRVLYYNHVPQTDVYTVL